MAAENTIHYTSVNHAYHLIGAINRLRQHSELCDITLNCGDVKIAAHKLILSVSSPYFKNLLNIKPQISQNVTEIQLRGIDGEGVQQIIEFFYTSAISVTEDSVWKLLPAASLLNSEEITTLCCDFLLSQLQVENCLQVHRIATKCLCSNLLSESTKFIKENFDKVLEEEIFLEMPFGTLMSHLKRMNDVVLNEDQMLRAMKCWMIYSIDDRQIYGLRIMEEFPKLEKKLQDFIPMDMIREGKNRIASLAAKKGACSDYFEVDEAKIQAEVVQSSPEVNQCVQIGVDVDLCAAIKLDGGVDSSSLTFQTSDSPHTSSENANLGPLSGRLRLKRQQHGDQLNLNKVEDFETSDEEVTWIAVNEDCYLDRSANDVLTHNQCSTSDVPINDFDSAKFVTKKLLKCSLCGFLSKTPHSRKVHELQHRNLKFPCDECSKAFSCKEYLKSHKKAHLKSFQCEICFKVFGRKHHYKEHVKVHEQNGFHCEHCTFVTNYRQSMYRHIKIAHDPNKSENYCCSSCGKHFNRIDMLKRHEEKCNLNRQMSVTVPAETATESLQVESSDPMSFNVKCDDSL